MLLSLMNVTVKYGTAEAVRSVTLDLAEGTVVSIIGANGSGKSTILKSISGLVPVYSGEIWFLGKRISGMPVDEIVRFGIAHVPEGGQLFPFMSVLSNLRLGAYSRKDKIEIEKDLDKIFERFPKLMERRNQKAGSLSGGEQRMLAIARAIMARPKLLLMDEPSLGLAPLAIERVAEVIQEINRDGISVLLAEQNAELVTNVSNRGYVLEVGQVVLEGNIRELVDNDLVKKAFLGG